MKILSLALALLTAFSGFPVMAQEIRPEDKDYFIEMGDVVSIVVQPATEFSREVTVQPDGNIELTLIGVIRAQGMRPAELQRLLMAKFAKYVSNPVITVSVRKFSFSRVALIGQVKGSGYFEYREGMRLLDLVAAAGGTADYAQEDKVRVYRKTKGENGNITEEVLPADLRAVFSGKMDKNIMLSSGDIVYVPRKGYASGARWIGDNLMPWASVLTLFLTYTLVTR